MPLPRNSIDIAWLTERDWWSRIDQAGDGCWLWRQSCSPQGYGQTWDGSHVLGAHRVAWVLHHERQIPDGMTIDHICRNRRCCRPDHLRLLTNTANATDNGQGRKTHCPKGHPYEGDNLRIYTNPKGQTCRKCRACQALSNAARFVRDHHGAP